MTKIPQELFGDAVMVMEFLHTFGPLFNIREVIHGGITYGKEIVDLRKSGGGGVVIVGNESFDGCCI